MTTQNKPAKMPAAFVLRSIKTGTVASLTRISFDDYICVVLLENGNPVFRRPMTVSEQVAKNTFDDPLYEFVQYLP